MTTPISYLPESYYDAFLSDAAKERTPNPIRGLYPLEKTPGVISLLAGKPNASTFPFTSISLSTLSPTSDEATTLTITGSDLEQALQYGDTAGSKHLLDWLFGLQEHSHGRKRNEGWRISVGTGSQDLIFKAATALVNPGDHILIETPTYSSAIAIFQGLHCTLIDVETDAQGIRSSHLREILEKWPESKPRPKALYTVPYGNNPTGLTATEERRREVLELAKKYDFIILEDDPYFNLYYGSAPRPPSYFSLEKELPEVGRVLRFDSLSKIISAGMRIGFASGPEPLLKAIDLHTATANLQSSSLVQGIAFKLLDHWGYDGFIKHTERVSAFYRNKRDIFERAMEKHLSGLVEWVRPEAGMFFWFKLLLPSHLQSDSGAIIRTKAYEKGVLALPGTSFLPGGGQTPYVRASFSLIPEEDIDEALKRLREVLLNEIDR